MEHQRTGARKSLARLLTALMIASLVCSLFPATAAAAPLYAASFPSNTIPAAMTAGQSYEVSVTVKNTGTATWTAAGGYRLVAAGGSDPLATSVRFPLAPGDSIKPNATKTFRIKMNAPLKSTTVVTDWQMYKGAQKISTVLTKRVTVRLAQKNSLIVNASVPSDVKAGSDFIASVTVKNIGSAKWTAAGGYKLVATLSFMGYPVFVKGYPLSSADAVATGGVKTFQVPMEAPVLAGDFTLTFQMACYSARFGATASRPLPVSFTDDQLLEIATYAVEYAEETRSQDDLDAARELVDALPTSSGKAALSVRLDALQDVLDAVNDYLAMLYNARTAVEKAEGSRLQADVDAARPLVQALPAGSFRTMLEVRLGAVQAILDQAAADAVIARISALPLPGSLTLSDKPAVAAARAAYDALTGSQKLLITNNAVLQAAEARIAELEADKAAADAAAVQADADALQIGYAAGDSASGVKKDLALAVAGANGSAIAWASGDGAAVSAAAGALGKVTRPGLDQGDLVVTLTATISKGGASQTRVFTVTVLAYPTNAEAVAKDAEDIVIGYADGDNEDSVTQNLSLPTLGALGSQISWRSGNYAVIRHATPFSLGDNGKVFRPIADTEVTLTALIVKGTERLERTFTVLVKGDNTTPDALAVLGDAADLAIGYAAGESASGVKSNLTLASYGSRGSAILWESSDEKTVVGHVTPFSQSLLGKVTRPTLLDGDKVITLTATISKGGASQVKTFTVTVLAYPTNAEAVAKDAEDIVIGYADGDNEDSVTQNLSLPTLGALGSQISWRSGNYAVIRHATPFSLGDNGKVFRPIADTEVTLTALIVKGTERLERTFTVLVKGDNTTPDALAVLGDAADLAIGYAAGESASGVKSNLTLASYGSRGSAILWESSDEKTVVGHVTPFSQSLLGRVTRPTLEEGDKVISLTATISRGGASQVKTFTVTVLAYPTNAEAVAKDAEDIVIGYADGDNEDSVTQNLTLPKLGALGSQISWTSSHYNIIRHNMPMGPDNTGKVFRPVVDTVVTLTATIFKGGVLQDRVFTVTVKGDDTTEDALAVLGDATDLAIGYAAGESASGVKSNLTLASYGSRGSAILWESSDEKTVVGHVTPFSQSLLGRVTRPTLEEGDKVISLTATISRGGASQVKTFTVTVKAPEYSSYTFEVDDTLQAVAGTEKAVDVRLKASAPRDIGYARVRFDVAVTKPEGSVVHLYATDTNGQQHDVAAIGYWGPTGGFPISADYDAATAFRGVFDTAGTYTVTMALKDLDANTTLASKTVTVDVIPAHSSYSFTAGGYQAWPGVEKTAGVTLKTGVLGAAGYDRVRINVSIDKPDGSAVHLYATDTNGQQHDVAAIGYWGPTGGFPIPADYTATTEFTGVFSAVGTYTITMTLKDLDSGATLAVKTVQVTVANPTNADAVAADKAALTMGFQPGDSASSVTGDLILSTQGRWGSQISWRFDPPMFGIGFMGSVLGDLKSRPLDDTPVTVTATIAKGGVVEDKVFTVIVKATDDPAADALRADKAALQIGFADGDSASHVSQNIQLATSLPNGSAVWWSSSDACITTPSPFSGGGKVTRETADKQVTLTANLSYAGFNTTKVFVVTVLAQ